MIQMLQEVKTIYAQNVQKNVKNICATQNEKIYTRKCGMDGSKVQCDPIAFLFLEGGRRSDVHQWIVR